MIVAKEAKLFNGRIAELNNSVSAEIEFIINNDVQKARLCKQVYFYNARLIPQEDPINKYMYIDMEVTFICNMVQINEMSSKWIVIMCWPMKHTLGDKIDIEPGMIHVPGHIFNLEDKEGILTATLDDEEQLNIFFMLKNFFVYGKNLSSHPQLVHQLNAETIVYFNALPCLPKENKYNCKLIASCVYIGPKPNMDNVVLGSTNEVATKVLQIIQNNFDYPLHMYIIGKGIFLKSIDNNFGLILAQFQDNHFKEILFHKKNAYVFNMCLANKKLSDILKKGDRMHFIAIAAAVNKFIDWIAVQVSVCDYGE